MASLIPVTPTTSNNHTITVEHIITPDLQQHIEDELRPRPPVPAVHGICTHVARSKDHSCGSHRCVELFGY
jgi:hypothetical protein